jgi:hypothetical protein
LIAFLHMLKAGGTSFRSLLEPVYRDRLYCDYDDIPMSNRPEHALERRARMRAVQDQGLPPNTAIVFGHFVLSKYLFLRPQPAYATMFREPVARTVSHYFHYQRYRGNPRNELLPEHLSLLEFARLPKYADTYRFLLGDVPMSELSYIGLTEEFDRSVRLFNRMFGVELRLPSSCARKSVHLNRAQEYHDPLSYLESEGLLEEVTSAQRINIEIYKQAKERFANLCAHYGV